MKDVAFSINVYASRETVWDTLWQDETFRQWADIIDPGTHLIGDLKEGNEVQFISGNGYGVTSLVHELVPGSFLLLKHRSDTQENGSQEREDEWTGGEEKYELTEDGGVTSLMVTFGVPANPEDYFNETYPEALEKVKALAEKTTS